LKVIVASVPPSTPTSPVVHDGFADGGNGGGMSAKQPASSACCAPTASATAWDHHRRPLCHRFRVLAVREDLELDA
jgi:hypothetical protein